MIRDRRCQYCIRPAIYTIHGTSRLCSTHYIRFHKYGSPHIVGRRGKPATECAWEPAFFDELRIHGNVVQACGAAGISRQFVYAKRQFDKRFAQLWEDALGATKRGHHETEAETLPG